MKKILLSLALFSMVLVGKSQTVLNEVYTDPGSGKNEFIELYNTAASTQQVDCFTIITYWESGANKGWYVLDLPAAVIPSKGWYTISSANPANVQAQVGVAVDANWNSLAASGYLKKYQVSGGTYTLVATGTVTDLLQDVSPTGASGHNYFTFLLQDGVPINAFWGGGPSATLPSGITSMPNLTGLVSQGACSVVPFDFKPSTWGAVEHVNSAPGSDNGYARTSDGKCGAWSKTSSPGDHTPGKTNGSAAGVAGALTTAQTITCYSSPGMSLVTYNISAVSGDASIANDFPVDILLYYDNPPLLTLGPEDVFQRSHSRANIAPAADPAVDTFQIAQSKPVILIYKTKRGCFDKVIGISNSCLPVPVLFKAFTAARNHSTVLVKWETSFEQNSSGFAVERNVHGTWQQVAFVSSQAPGGESDGPLSYQYNDPNNINGISQYRIRQVDFDLKAKYSDIRAVRGEGQIGKTVVFPNPSVTGNVSVVFEDATVARNISLMDMSGRVVKSWKGVTNNNIQIDNLTPGMYSLRIVVPETGDQSVEKIIVSKR